MTCCDSCLEYQWLSRTSRTSCRSRGGVWCRSDPFQPEGTGAAFCWWFANVGTRILKALLHNCCWYLCKIQVEVPVCCRVSSQFVGSSILRAVSFLHILLSWPRHAKSAQGVSVAWGSKPSTEFTCDFGTQGLARWGLVSASWSNSLVGKRTLQSPGWVWSRLKVHLCMENQDFVRLFGVLLHSMRSSPSWLRREDLQRSHYEEMWSSGNTQSIRFYQEGAPRALVQIGEDELPHSISKSRRWSRPGRVQAGFQRLSRFHGWPFGTGGGELSQNSSRLWNDTWGRKESPWWNSQDFGSRGKQAFVASRFVRHVHVERQRQNAWVLQGSPTCSIMVLFLSFSAVFRCWTWDLHGRHKWGAASWMSNALLMHQTFGCHVWLQTMPGMSRVSDLMLACTVCGDLGL